MLYYESSNKKPTYYENKLTYYDIIIHRIKILNTLQSMKTIKKEIQNIKPQENSQKQDLKKIKQAIKNQKNINRIELVDDIIFKINHL